MRRKSKTLFLLAMAAAWAQPPDTPDWQKAAGGAMSFEVASVKPTKAPSFPGLALMGEAPMPGGRLSIAAPLERFINFAYKLRASPEQERALMHLPQPVSGFYEIGAKAEGHATKDQMRLMMQSLLADRFKLKVHFETQDVAAFALSLVKPGQTGPKLRPHDESLPCPDTDPPLERFAPKPGEAFPPICGVVLGFGGSMWMSGGRNITMATLAEFIYTQGNSTGEVERPVIDKTGLEGRFDFAVEFSMGDNGPLQRLLSRVPGAQTAEAPPREPASSNFLEAVRKQLGLKLTPDKGAIQVLVVDHVEPPSEN
jgi:bla regulator protein blaR1